LITIVTAQAPNDKWLAVNTLLWPMPMNHGSRPSCEPGVVKHNFDKVCNRVNMVETNLFPAIFEDSASNSIASYRMLWPSQQAGMSRFFGTELTRRPLKSHQYMSKVL
jgi:hypothetical protein